MPVVELKTVDFAQPFPGHDVAFDVDDGKVYFIRALLTVQSSYFDKMFNGEFKETAQQVVALPGNTVEELTKLFRLLFPAPGRLQTIENNDIFSILDMAFMYTIDDLKERCIKQIISPFGEPQSSLGDKIAALAIGIKHNIQMLLDQFSPLVREQATLAVLVEYKESLGNGDLYFDLLEHKLKSASVDEVKTYGQHLPMQRFQVLLLEKLTVTTQLLHDLNASVRAAHEESRHKTANVSQAKSGRQCRTVYILYAIAATFFAVVVIASAGSIIWTFGRRF